MRPTANQVTLVRLILLPAAVWALYRADQMSGETARAWGFLGALALFVLLGFTDALDGYLARRYGSTPLGRLLDPLADKIFLAAAYVPMVHLGVAPLWLAQVIFVREFLLTFLRSGAFEDPGALATSAAGKLKTTVQMAGAGFMLLIWLLPEGPAIRGLMAAAAALSFVPLLYKLLRGRRPGWRALWAPALIGTVAVVRLSASGPVSLLVLAWIIAVFTVYSGLEYLWAFRAVLARATFRTPGHVLLALLQCTLVPVGILPLLDGSWERAFWVASVIAAELAHGGLDSFLFDSGRRFSVAAAWLRVAIQGAAVAWAWAGWSPGGAVAPGDGALRFLLAGSVILLLLRLLHNRDLIAPSVDAGSAAAGG